MHGVNSYSFANVGMRSGNAATPNYALAPHVTEAVGAQDDLLRMVGTLAGTYKHTSPMTEKNEIDRLLSRVRAQKKPSIFAEPHIRYEQSPFKEGGNPI